MATATAEPKPVTTAALTERVILKRERAIILPDDIAPARLKDLKALGNLADDEVEVWLVVDTQRAVSKEKAIEAHAGKPNTPGARPGVYRAPTAATWKGGLVYERPPETKVERRHLDD